MRVYDVKNIKFRDGLAEKRRRIFVLKILFFIGLTVAIAGLVLYLLFFSGFLKIKNISVTGLTTVNKEEFDRKLADRLNLKLLPHIESQKNLLFFDGDSFGAELIGSFPQIKDVFVKKEAPNSLSVGITERKALGVWCFGPPAGACKYFDQEGVFWGQAARSSGFLMLNVDDARNIGEGEKTADKNLFETVLLVNENLKALNILTGKVIIPESSIGDFKVVTADGYDLLFNLDSNISDQLEILKIFLAEKRKETPPAGGFSPRYIDLRIDGRIYYK